MPRLLATLHARAGTAQGYEVDVYESRPFIGGKVASWQKDGNHVEMGLHVVRHSASPRRARPGAGPAAPGARWPVSYKLGAQRWLCDLRCDSAGAGDLCGGLKSECVTGRCAVAGRCAGNAPRPAAGARIPSITLTLGGAADGRARLCARSSSAATSTCSG